MSMARSWSEAAEVVVTRSPVKEKSSESGEGPTGILAMICEVRVFRTKT